MNLRNPFVGGRCGVYPDEATQHTGVFQATHNSAQTVRRFRMARSHIMFKILRMIDEPGAPHDLYFQCRRLCDTDERGIIVTWRSDDRQLSGERDTVHDGVTLCPEDECPTLVLNR